MYAFWLRKKISSKHLLSRKGVHFHRKNRFSHNKKTNHRKNRFSHKKKTNLRLLDSPNELITLLHRTSSHTTISLTPVKIYPSSVNESYSPTVCWWNNLVKVTFIDLPYHALVCTWYRTISSTSTLNYIHTQLNWYWYKSTRKKIQVLRMNERRSLEYTR